MLVPAVTQDRDSLLGIALVLELMATTGKSIQELVNEILKYEIVKEKYTKSKITTIDSIKIDLENSWLHLRSSNT